MQASISTEHHGGHDVAQWIKNEDVTGDGITDYVYGELRSQRAEHHDARRPTRSRAT